MEFFDGRTGKKIDLQEEIPKKALQLKKLDQKSIEAFLSNDFEIFFNKYNEFYKLKDSLRDYLQHFGVLSINNEDARSIINKISVNDPFESDKIYNKLIDLINNLSESEDKESIIDDSLQNKAVEWFHSNYGALDIYLRRISFGPIALESAGYDLLDSYILEACECYAFGNYNALFALCRTILEASMLDICGRKGLIKNVDCGDILPSTLRDMTSIKGSSLNNKLRKIYGKCSKVIHGKITRGLEESKEVLKETINIVKELYKFHNLL